MCVCVCDYYFLSHQSHLKWNVLICSNYMNVTLNILNIIFTHRFIKTIRLNTLVLSLGLVWWTQHIFPPSVSCKIKIKRQSSRKGNRWYNKWNASLNYSSVSRYTICACTRVLSWSSLQALVQTPGGHKQTFAATQWKACSVPRTMSIVKETMTRHGKQYFRHFKQPDTETRNTLLAWERIPESCVCQTPKAHNDNPSVR